MGRRIVVVVGLGHAGGVVTAVRVVAVGETVVVVVVAVAALTLEEALGA